MIQRDGIFHDYAAKTTSELLSIPPDKLDPVLPKEVRSPLNFTDRKFLKVWEAVPRLRIETTQTSPQTLRVHIRRLNRGYRNSNLLYAPKFPKPQQESWFVIASDAAEERLLSLQRVTLSSRGRRDAKVDVEIPAVYTGDTVNLRILSDGWRGLDVEKTVPWKGPGVWIDSDAS